MTSNVYFAAVEDCEPGRGIVIKMADLFDRAGFADIIEKGDRVAIKTHTGDLWSPNSIRPQYIRRVVDKVKERGGIPYVADATVLYSGTRWTGQGLLEAANINGFNSASLGCPVICADGMDGYDGEYLLIPDGIEMNEIYMAKGFVEADAMMVVAPIGPLFGLRGAVKHIGMGCCAKYGKMKDHEVSKQSIDPEKCIGCGSCVPECAVGAIKVDPVKKKANIDLEKCLGDGFCYEACKYEAVKTVLPDGLIRRTIRVADAAAALKRHLKGKVGHYNVLMSITDECDCHNYHRGTLLPDIGVLASKDPIALDKATYDLMTAAPGVSSYFKGLGAGINKVEKVQPWYNLDKYLEAGEKLGLGTQEYKLIHI